VNLSSRLQPSSLQVSEYVENGFVIVRDLLDAEDVNRLREVCDDFALGRLPTVATTKISLGAEAVPESEMTLAGMTDEERLRSVLNVYYPEWVSEAYEHLIAHAGVGQIVDALIAGRICDWDGRSACILDYVFYKPPGELGRAWHQDATYLEADCRTLTSVSIVVDESRVDNGCLWFLPGSHQSSQQFPMGEHGKPEKFDHARESYGFDDATEVPVIAQPGDAIFFDGYLLHRSGENSSADSRRAIVMHWLDNETRHVWRFPNDPVWPPESSISVWRFPEIS
jgi:phytanoyl-CoA hydroxylase